MYVFLSHDNCNACPRSTPFVLLCCHIILNDKGSINVLIMNNGCSAIKGSKLSWIPTSSPTMIQRPVGHSQSISNTVIPDLPHAGLPDELFNPQPLKPGARMDVTSKAEWRMSPEDYERSVSIMHGFHATSSEEAIAYFPPLFDVGRMRLRETQRKFQSSLPLHWG